MPETKQQLKKRLDELEKKLVSLHEKTIKNIQTCRNLRNKTITNRDTKKIDSLRKSLGI